MTHMDYLWSNMRSVKKCEPQSAISLAYPQPVPPASTLWIWYAVISVVVLMACARFHRPRRLRRGSIWHNPVTGSSTLYL